MDSAVPGCANETGIVTISAGATLIKNLRVFTATAALLCLTSPVASTASAKSGEVNVYTYRETKLIQPLLDAFTSDTGIKVNIVSASSGLEQREPSSPSPYASSLGPYFEKRLVRL